MNGLIHGLIHEQRRTDDCRGVLLYLAMRKLVTEATYIHVTVTYELCMNGKRLGLQCHHKQVAEHMSPLKGSIVTSFPC
jgi:hypothetical protein